MLYVLVILFVIKKSVYVFKKLIFEFKVKLKRIDEYILNDCYVI